MKEQTAKTAAVLFLFLPSTYRAGDKAVTLVIGQDAKNHTDLHKIGKNDIDHAVQKGERRP